MSLEKHLSAGEYIEFQFSAFTWTRVSVNLNGAWENIALTNQGIITKTKLFSFSWAKIPWEQVADIRYNKKGLGKDTITISAKSFFRKKQWKIPISLDISIKKLNDDELYRLTSILQRKADELGIPRANLDMREGVEC
ncbi:MAG: hypothetical protein QCI38_00650 [Candidatus Thermoplasmatota archaeon]|nr:hypothetical protein [Candidatus Thermoplasmatota archaeon]